MLLAARLFGGHVRIGAQAAAALVHDFFFGHRQSKVGHVYLFVAIEQNVARFDVAMEEVLAMGVMQGIGRLGDHGRCQRKRYRPLRDALQEALTLDVLVNQEAPALGVADVVERHDMRVIEAGNIAGLAQKGFTSVNRREALRARHLDGDLPLGPIVDAEEHCPEPAATEAAAHGVATDTLGQRRHTDLEEQLYPVRLFGEPPHVVPGGRFLAGRLA
jgi:hypothetical protein